MNRRDFVRIGFAAVAATGAGKLERALAQSPGAMQMPGTPQHSIRTKDKVAVITGGASGIGKEVARASSPKAVAVVINGHDAARS